MEAADILEKKAKIALKHGDTQEAERFLRRAENISGKKIDLPVKKGSRMPAIIIAAILFLLAGIYYSKGGTGQIVISLILLVFGVIALLNAIISAR